MARPREFNPEAALEQALVLFWEKGYGDTSFDDLVKTTGVSRYGLYEVFGSKRDLFRKALQNYMDRFEQQYQAELRRPDASVAEIRGYFESLMDLAATEAADRGCLICNTAVEMAHSDEDIAADVRSFFQGMVAMFTNVLRNARERGELNPDIDIDDWAVSLMALNQSSAHMARVGLGAKMIRRNIEASLSTLEAK